MVLLAGRGTRMDMMTTALLAEGEAVWRSATGVPAPAGGLLPAGDRLSAAAALGAVRDGHWLLYSGRYANARQLLTAMGRRLVGREPVAVSDPGAAFRGQRRLRALTHALLSRLLVVVEGPDFRPRLAGAPPLGTFGEQVWGPVSGRPLLVPLREWIGAVGAREWHKVGVSVPAVGGRIHPRYGVFAPTRGDYLDLFTGRARLTDLAGKVAFDIGTGTGVLALILARQGAARVEATDADARAVACARENAGRLGYADVVRARQVDPDDPFPQGTADLVVCNPPWLPGDGPTPLDRAVYDPGGRFLARFLDGAGEHLAPGGRAWLILSDLAERLRLRVPGFVEQQAVRSGLAVLDRSVVPARSTRPADREDVLLAERSRERITLYVLGRRLESRCAPPSAAATKFSLP
jgi:SAM-dependent methyltransferase